ncbi:MAG: hypothetical protein LBB72_07840 [Spirochaetaceae bacterium]|jgi:hypothetical protein|nr:hypothetical protein [Spirochaetaceae bacterium]
MVGVSSSKAKTKKQFDAIRKRAEKLGVLDISFSRANSSPDVLECYNRTLDVIEKNKAILYQNAGETEK